MRVSEVQEQMKELERSKLSDQISLELNNAWVNLTESLKKVAIVSSSLDIAHDNLVLNTFSYNEGKLPVIDVLSAQVTWIQSYSSLIQTWLQQKVSLADYNKAISH